MLSGIFAIQILKSVTSKNTRNKLLCRILLLTTKFSSFLFCNVLVPFVALLFQQKSFSFLSNWEAEENLTTVLQLKTAILFSQFAKSKITWSEVREMKSLVHILGFQTKENVLVSQKMLVCNFSPAYWASNQVQIGTKSSPLFWDNGHLKRKVTRKQDKASQTYLLPHTRRCWPCPQFTENWTRNENSWMRLNLSSLLQQTWIYLSSGCWMVESCHKLFGVFL